ncbi:MAG: type II toxin-antitoxin system HicA family toxin [Pseudomonadota bacterium]
MDSRTLLKELRKDGWVVVRSRGSHHQLKHPIKKGLVTLPHPKKELPKGTVASIKRQAGLQARR